MGWNYLSIPKLQRCNRWSLRMDKQFHPTFYQACNYLSMLGLKLNHVSKRGHWSAPIPYLNRRYFFIDVYKTYTTYDFVSKTFKIYVFGDRWIPLTKGKGHGKFPLSWRHHVRPSYNCSNANEVSIKLNRPDKMAAILQTTFWNAFGWMKRCRFRLWRFH